MMERFCHVSTVPDNQPGKLLNIKVFVNHERSVAIHLIPSAAFTCKFFYALVHSCPIIKSLFIWHRRLAHLLAVPLLSAPALTILIDNASARSATSIILHVLSGSGEFKIIHYSASS